MINMELQNKTLPLKQQMNLLEFRHQMLFKRY